MFILYFSTKYTTQRKKNLEKGAFWTLNNNAILVLCLILCHFVLVFFSPFSIAITSFGEERANLSVFRTFVRFVLVWTCRFPLPLGDWEGLRFVTVALPGLTYLLPCFYTYQLINVQHKNWQTKSFKYSITATKTCPLHFFCILHQKSKTI